MIVHIFNSSVVSGPETLAIPALKKLNDEVQLIFLSEERLGDRVQGPIEYAQKNGYKTHSIDIKKRWDSKAFVKLRDLIDSLSPKIVHAHDVKASTYLLMAKKVRPGFFPKMISTHHGAAARKGLIRLYEEFYVRLILPSFDAVLCVCESDKKSLMRRGLLGKKVFIHLNGVDRPLVSQQSYTIVKNSIRKKWGIPENVFLLGAVARLSDEKRHDRMLRVLSKIKYLDPQADIHLACFGVGVLESNLKKMTTGLELTERVHWMGYSNTIGSEISGFDLLLCLSDGEGIPINLIEAGWSGTPVLSTSVGGIPDLIPDEKYGFLVEKSDSDEWIAEKILKIYKNQNLLRDVAGQFQSRVQSQFSEKSWLEQLSSVYSQQLA